MNIEKIIKREYIELNSSYRNRNLYPFPAKFEVNVGNAGMKNQANTALDPISNSQAIASFNSGALNTLTSTMDGVPSAPILNNLVTTYSVVGAVLRDTNTSEETTIITQDTYTNKVTVSPTFSNNWAPGDTYDFLNLSTNQNIFYPGGNSIEDGKFVGQLLYNLSTQEYRTITDYKNNMFTVDSAYGGGWTNADDYEIVSSQIIETDTTGTIIAGDLTTGTITLNASASSVDGFYINRFVRFFEDTNRPPLGPSDTQLITQYNGTTKVAIITPVNLSNFDVNATIRYEILPFTKDLASYLNYIGQENNERSLYRISLNSIILPNVELDNPNGGRIVFYPYVYVVFRNKSIGVNSLINSNNPNSTRATFRVPIADVPDKELSNFVRLSSNMVNIFEFNPYEDIIFEVYLSDGTLFKTVEQDTTSPVPVVENIQISCNFSLEKLK